MKKFISFAFLIAAFSAAASLAPRAARANEGDTHLAVSGPLDLVSGSAFWGLSGTVFYEITPRWWLGGQTGFFDWSSSFGGSSASEWFIPIVPTLLYNLDPLSPGFHPYLGVGLGVAYVHNSYSPAGGPGLSASGVKFDGSLHVGAKFGRQRHFFADIGIGVLDGSFSFAPAIGWMFAL